MGLLSGLLVAIGIVMSGSALAQTGLETSPPLLSPPLTSPPLGGPAQIPGFTPPAPAFRSTPQPAPQRPALRPVMPSEGFKKPITPKVAIYEGSPLDMDVMAHRKESFLCVYGAKYGYSNQDHTSRFWHPEVIKGPTEQREWIAIYITPHRKQKIYAFFRPPQVPGAPPPEWRTPQRLMVQQLHYYGRNLLNPAGPSVNNNEVALQMAIFNETGSAIFSLSYHYKPNDEVNYGTLVQSTAVREKPYEIIQGNYIYTCLDRDHTD